MSGERSRLKYIYGHTSLVARQNVARHRQHTDSRKPHSSHTLTNMSAPAPYLHRFRVNPRLSYSERMTQTRSELRTLVRDKLCEWASPRNLPHELY